jgi:hypothetical protein
MGKKELATLIDAYSDAKASGNKYLTQTMIAQLERALDEVFGADQAEPDMVESSSTSDEY